MLPTKHHRLVKRMQKCSVLDNMRNKCITCRDGWNLRLWLGNPVKNDRAQQQIHDAHEIRDLVQAQQMLVALQVALPELAGIHFLI